MAHGRQQRQQRGRRVKDFIAVVESPTNEARSNARDRGIKKTIPNKPIRYLGSSRHPPLRSSRRGANLRRRGRDGHHRRPAIKYYFQKVVLGPQSRTLEPDRLSQFPFATTGPGPLMLPDFHGRVRDQRRAAEHHAVPCRQSQSRRRHADRISPAGEDLDQCRSRAINNLRPQRIAFLVA